jgi:hypothetical protein
MLDPWYLLTDGKPWYLKPFIYIGVMIILITVFLCVYIVIKWEGFKDEIKSRIRKKHSSGICKPG